MTQYINIVEDYGGKCPKCGEKMLLLWRDTRDGFMYDACPHCGFAHGEIAEVSLSAEDIWHDIFMNYGVSSCEELIKKVESRQSGCPITTSVYDYSQNPPVPMFHKIPMSNSGKMIYINALELLNEAVKHGILQEKDGGILVYRKGTAMSKEGWYLTDKDLLAKELMNDKKGQDLLISALKQKNVDFKPTDYSWFSNLK